MGNRHTVIVAGILGEHPYGGIVWQILHYMEGLRRLGFDVYYFEDTGCWTIDPEYSLAYIDRTLRHFGFGDRWMYRSTPLNASFGLAETAFSEVIEKATALFNVTGSTLLKDEFLSVPIRAHIETDPVEFQVKYYQHATEGIPKDDLRFFEYLGNIEKHTHFFTFGENFGAPDCDVPLLDIAYIPTRQPVVTDWWRGHEPTGKPDRPLRFTTIANWDQLGEKDIQWKGMVQNWSKSAEFLRYVDIPRRASQTFELALANLTGEHIKISPEDAQALRSAGWHLTEAIDVSQDADGYRSYIQGSDAEFTVAKSQYHRLRSGWFSDRTACYLAAGRPAVTQDTGFGNILPSGEGLFGFATLDDVVAQVDAIAADYVRHSKAAQNIAREWFEAEKVVGDMAKALGLA